PPVKTSSADTAQAQCQRPRGTCARTRARAICAGLAEVVGIRERGRGCRVAAGSLRSKFAYIVWLVVLVACGSAQEDGKLTDPNDGAGGKSSSGGSGGGKASGGSGGGSAKKQTCTDLKCGEHASCSDSSGDAACRCDKGYEGDGQNCTDV